jgi:DNA-binding NtrC family response regulator
MGTLALVGSSIERGSLAAGRLLALSGAGAEIGRHPPPGRMRTVVKLADRSVSGYHARITELSDGFVIEDRGSTNGTVVDGRRITGPTPLREGAVLFLGAQVVVFRTMTSVEVAAVEADLADPFAPVATLSPVLAVTCAKLRLLAASPTELFLVGKTGVGKEVFATAIHEASGRKGRLMAINCAALPRELVESELFGYERGAHSTAKDRKAGLIEAAQGGTLFLDELAEMPLDVQSKLLRFLQDRKYTPVGSTRLETANVRIIAASSSLAEPAGQTKIQDALLGRLGAQPIELPALRDRPEDLGRLVSHFLSASACPRAFDEEAFRALFLHDWPHNVRELQKVVLESALLSGGSEAIGLDHLPPVIADRLYGPSHRGAEAVACSRPAPSPAATPVSSPAEDPIRGAPPPVATAGRRDGAAVRRPAPSAGELRALMEKFQGNVTHVSNHLGRQWAVISRTLSRHRIDPADYRPGGCAEGGRRPGATFPIATLDSLSATQRVPSASHLDEGEGDDGDSHEDSLMGA